MKSIKSTSDINMLMRNLFDKALDDSVMFSKYTKDEIDEFFTLACPEYIDSSAPSAAASH